jgi:hypothetical protein
MDKLNFIIELRDLFNKYNIKISVGDNMTANEWGEFYCCGSSLILKAPEFEVDLREAVISGWIEGEIE